MTGSSHQKPIQKRVLFQGALFDMDGLLLDTERVCMQAFEEVVGRFGLPPMPEVVLSCIGLRADATQDIVDRALSGRVVYEKFESEWRACFSQALSDEIPLRPGVTELLSLLAGQGTPCAVATSTQSALAEEHLEHAGLRDFFNVVIGGEQVDNAKPAPDIYIKAAAALGIKAVDCAAFEDSDPGTLAAIASGATVVQVPDIKQPSAALKRQNHVIADNLLAGAQKIGLIERG